MLITLCLSVLYDSKVYYIILKKKILLNALKYRIHYNSCQIVMLHFHMHFKEIIRIYHIIILISICNRHVTQN